jgi:hypothetical protein
MNDEEILKLFQPMWKDFSSEEDLGKAPLLYASSIPYRAI